MVGSATDGMNLPLFSFQEVILEDLGAEKKCGGQAPFPFLWRGRHECPYGSFAMPYVICIGNMVRDMITSCRQCPLAPCGHIRVSHKCRVRVEQHYKVPGTQPKGEDHDSNNRI